MGPSSIWVAVKESELSYQNPKSILFTIYPDYGNSSYHNINNMDVYQIRWFWDSGDLI